MVSIPELCNFIDQVFVNAENEIAIGSHVVEDLLVYEALTEVKPLRKIAWFRWVRFQLLKFALEQALEPPTPVERLNPWPECCNGGANDHDYGGCSNVSPETSYGNRGAHTV
jgi:hypothetical protein